MRTVALLTLAFTCLLAAPAWAGSPAMDRKERAMLRGINHQRAKHGLGAVQLNGGLAKAADYHSWEMLDANYFDHPSRDGGPFDKRVRRFVKKRALGETLAMLGGSCGRGSAHRIVKMWMHSSGHRAILLSSKYRRIGIARRTGKLGGSKACVVTADFSSKK